MHLIAALGFMRLPIRREGGGEGEGGELSKKVEPYFHAVCVHRARDSLVEGRDPGCWCLDGEGSFLPHPSVSVSPAPSLSRCRGVVRLSHVGVKQG